jgi:predicted TIM-barrel fold metal-dependent hydrolase
MSIFELYEGPDRNEDVIEPEVRLIDAHHHVWPKNSPIAAYDAAEFRKELATEHNVIATVFAECMAGYLETEDEALRPVGETEYVVRSFPPAAPDEIAIAAGIVGWADLRQPGVAARTLDAHIEAGCGRFSGVRYNVYWHEDPAKFTTGPRTFPPHLLLDRTFRDGLREVERRGLTYDVWMYSDQLPELAVTADSFPDLSIVLCHMGGPVTAVHTPEGRGEVFDRWRVQLAELSERPNVYLKVGGLGMGHFGFAYGKGAERPSSDLLAALWRPYFDVALEAFGPARCMAESNFPPDRHGFSYATFWNALKMLSQGFSDCERASLFVDTARRVYRLDLHGITSSAQELA